MKIRNGFVSNSSSSSFIVAVPNEDYEVDIVVKSKIRFSQYSDMDEAIKTKEQLDNHIIYSYGCKSETVEKVLGYNEWLKEIYQTCLKELEKGKVIIFGSFDSHGDNFESFLCETDLNGNIKDKNVKVIQNVTLDIN